MRNTSPLGRWIFDLAVLAAALSAVVMPAIGSWEPAIRFVGVAAVKFTARFGEVPAPFAGAFAVCLLLATWASVEHWYRAIDDFDPLVHLVTPGSLAAAAYFHLARRNLTPPASHRPGPPCKTTLSRHMPAHSMATR